jgi:hypothetical protein
LATAVTVTISAHDLGMKRYDEPYGQIGASDLGVEGDGRILPVTTQGNDTIMQSLGLLHSATLNSYFSATGTSGGILLKSFHETLPLDVFGVPSEDVVRKFIPSHLLRSFAVEYVIVGVEHRAVRRLLEDGGFHLAREGRSSATYRTPQPLPRAYFASRTYPFSRERLVQGLWENKAPPDAAFIEGWTGAETPPLGQVGRFTWDRDRVSLDVTAPSGGFLVISQSFFPGWRAFVDGQSVPLERVNHRVQGLSIPSGSRHVRLQFHSPTLRLGLGLSIVGGALLTLILATDFKRRPRDPSRQVHR